MPVTPETKPVEDSVPKVNNELAVGSDLEFQKKWRRFERVIWPLLIVFLILSFAGAFGRGPLAHATAKAADGSMVVKYERIQRFGTPSVMTIDLDPSAIQNGSVLLWASDSLVKPFGNQRIVPAPSISQIGNGGILYTFPASASPASVEFQTQPGQVGGMTLKLQVPGHSPVTFNVFVMP